MIRRVRQRHDLPNGFGIFPRFKECRDSLSSSLKGLYQLCVIEFSGEFAIEPLVDKARAATRDVDHLAYEVGIYARTEVFEVQVEIIHTVRQLGCEVVAQILWIEILQISAGVDEGASGLRHLGAVNGEEAVHVHGGWRAIVRAGQHRRPKQRVEVDDVFANKVIKLSV